MRISKSEFNPPGRGLAGAEKFYLVARCVPATGPTPAAGPPGRGLTGAEARRATHVKRGKLFLFLWDGCGKGLLITDSGARMRHG